MAVATSAATTASDLASHLKTRARELSRVKTRSAQQSKTEATRQAREQATKAANSIKERAAGTAEKARFPIFNVELGSIGAAGLKEVEGNDVSAFDWDAPFLWRECSGHDMCLKDVGLQRSLISWENQYKLPSPKNDGSGRHSYPLQPKFGKEACEKFFKALGIPGILDVSDVQGGPEFMSNTCLFGFYVGMEFLGFYPNHAACLRTHVKGQVEYLLINVTTLIEFQKNIDGAATASGAPGAGTSETPSAPDYDYNKIITTLGSYGTEELSKFTAAHRESLLTFVAKPGDVLLIPQGWVGLEKARRQGPEQDADAAIIGFRKSFMLQTKASAASYKVCLDLFKQAKRNTSRMEQIYEKMPKA